MEIHLRGVHRLVPKPQGDHRTVNTAVQQPRRGGVAQDMRCDLFALEGGAVLLCSGHMFGHQMRYTITPQRPSSGTGKQRLFGATLLFTVPCAQRGARVFAEWRTPFFAAFPLTADVCPVPKVRSCQQSPLNSETRRPVWTASNSNVRSR